MLAPLPARIILATALLPFLVFAGRDQLLHLRARVVSPAENVLHALIGLVLFVVIGRSFLFDAHFVAVGALIFILVGSLDEFIFHRALPVEEADCHAKEHFALFGFFAVAAVVLLELP